MNTQQVILVDENDNGTGTIDKMEAHVKGLRHRAFSIFIFNSKGELLLQQRAMNKYHSAGLWTNTCCSHPYPGEDTTHAALRRLYEEMGFRTSLTKVFDFIYKASFENGLIENEFDHVFAGEYEGEIRINPAEARDYSFKSMREIKGELKRNPGEYTEWFKIAFPKIESWWKERYGQL